VGAYFDHLEYGLISSLGGLAFLYLPNTALPPHGVADGLRVRHGSCSRWA
jgi:hypothetical protein